MPPAGFEPATPALGDRSKVLVTAPDLRKLGPLVTATDPVCRWLIARLLPVDHDGRTLVVEGRCAGEKLIGFSVGHLASVGVRTASLRRLVATECRVS